MRKCLNVMQACHLAYPQVDLKAVYMCTGKPLPDDIEEMLRLLLNAPYQEAFFGISKMQVEKGLAMSDIVLLLHDLVTRCSFPPNVLIYVLDKLSDVEFRLAQGVNEKVQLGSLVGIFRIAADMTAQATAAEAAA